MPELEYPPAADNYYAHPMPDGVRPHLPLELDIEGDPASYRIHTPANYAALDRVFEITKDLTLDERAQRAKERWGLEGPTAIS